MRILLQKVKEASVIINGEVYSKIDEGFVALVGFSINDSEEVVDRMISKFINLRILEDEEGKTNNSIMSKSLEVLSVSQFTLYADTKKGRRPSFSKSAKSDDAEKLYDYFNKQLNKEIPIKTGVFQEDMQVQLVNEGPFTIMLDSEEYGWHK
ncbi:MAG TPA: D-aminoacyl-tRNA deacylase [Erysipelotrichaceae bacterium]|nr:D-aminoacyl-tRNA deacylase [Erysipelotrichaceae bacterium]